MQSLKKNTLLNFLKTCSSIIYPLVTFPYISRILLPDNVGKVHFAQSYVNYFFLIAMLGVATYAVRECAAVREDRQKLGEVSSQIFSINVYSSIIAYILLFASLVFFRSLDNYRLLIIIESFIIFCSVVGADWLNIAMEDFTYITVRTVIAQFFAIIAMLLFVRNTDDYYIYAVICVFASSGVNLLNVWYRRKYCNICLTKQINWKKHFTPISILFVMMLSQTLFNNTDITMLGLMKNDYEVGLYSVANKVTRLIASVVQSLAFVIIPKLSLYFANNDFDNANRLLKKVLIFNLSFGLPLVIGVEMLANEIIYIVGGPAFADAVPVIRFQILAFMFSLVGGSFLGNAILIPMKNERYYMIVCLITAGCNIIINALLIPQFGAVGASIATAMNGFLIFLFMLLKVDKRIKIDGLKKVFFEPIVGCFGIVLCCFLASAIEFIWARIAVSVIFSTIIYTLILFFMKNVFALELISYAQRFINKRV